MIGLKGSLPEIEERILGVVNAVVSTSTAAAIAKFDSDGSPVMTGDIKWTVRCRSPKTYQMPYGAVEVERSVYQNSRGGKAFVPLESSARIIGSSTPRFAKQVIHKYVRMNAGEVCTDLSDNHGRKISRTVLQRLMEMVGGIAQLKEESWQYQTPVLEQLVKNELKHTSGAAQQILEELKGFSRQRSLSRTVREDLEASITYFENQSGRMDYATHIQENRPIGSGITEAACKTLIKQRFCCSGMRWKDNGMKAVMSLRALVLTKGRWQQFWDKINQYGVPCA